MNTTVEIEATSAATICHTMDANLSSLRMHQKKERVGFSFREKKCQGILFETKCQKESYIDIKKWLIGPEMPFLCSSNILAAFAQLSAIRTLFCN